MQALEEVVAMLAMHKMESLKLFTFLELVVLDISTHQFARHYLVQPLLMEPELHQAVSCQVLTQHMALVEQMVQQARVVWFTCNIVWILLCSTMTAQMV
jgi:hypothetical protein